MPVVDRNALEPPGPGPGHFRRRLPHGHWRYMPERGRVNGAAGLAEQRGEAESGSPNGRGTADSNVHRGPSCDREAPTGSRPARPRAANDDDRPMLGQTDEIVNSLCGGPSGLSDRDLNRGGSLVRRPAASYTVHRRVGRMGSAHARAGASRRG
ncbi:MAG: hypothetical protein MZV70_19730 [Desulfobacterales bacterium]|nr:hypothetical protein [Desulfobacterales bacterium]